MKRSPKQYLTISLKGFAMGLVEPLPGISGGTIAFVTGVYEEFLGTIKGAFPAFKQLFGRKPFAQRVTDFWTALNGNFLVALFAGMGVGAVIVLFFATHMQERHPVLFQAFIFGLIAASVKLICTKVGKWTPVCYLLAVLGVGLACLLPIPIKPHIDPDADILPFVPLGYMYLCSCVAACAFLLPGTSGSFFLYLLGAYYTLSKSATTLNFEYLAVIAAGLLTGMIAFSCFLPWLLKRYHDFTVAMMTGFVIGSLQIIWPWQIESGNYMVNTAPDMSTLPGVLTACVIGVVIVLGIDFAARRFRR